MSAHTMLAVREGMIDPADVAGLRDLWASIVAPGATAPPVPVRPLLDTLGLGLEQVYGHLAGERPTFDAFAAWVVATAGSPCRDRVERYHAWREGAPPPPAEVARQAAVMAHPPVFTAAELADWDRDGVVVLRGAIDRDAAGRIAAHLWTTIGASPDDPAGWYAQRQGGIMVQQFQHPAMDVPRRAPRIARAFAELYGHADLICSTDRLSFNPPERGGYRFPGPHLHWDANLTPPVPFEAQAILYLTDTAAEQGALRVVPGFHHRLAAGWLAALGDRDPRRVDLSAEAVPVAGGAGDLVIWRQELPHGASANTTDWPRLAQYVTWYPLRWPDTRAWR